MKKLSNSGLWCLGGPQSENKRKQKQREVLQPCKRTEKAIKHESDSDINYNWCFRNGLPKT